MANLHLVTGYAGQAHVTAADDGSFNRAIFGDGQYVFDFGSKFAASVVSNNKITIADGDLLMQGRHVRLNEGATVDLTITNGTQGKLRNDLIVARYTKDAVSGVEQVNLVVIQGTAVDSDPTDPEHTSGDIINDHDLLNDMPLYRVPLDGLNVGTPVALFDLASVQNSDANLADAVEKKHAHTNKELLDSYSQTNANLADAVTKKHAHTNKRVLDTYDKTQTELLQLGWNPNLLDNWCFLSGFVVNQRGKTHYSGTGETVDGLRALNNDITVDVTDGGLVITNTATDGGYVYLCWPTETPGYMCLSAGCTVSVVTSDGFFSGLHNVTAGSAYFYDTGADHYTLGLRISPGSSVTILAIKAELGTRQTLVHKDANGDWMYNAVPNYREELAKASGCTLLWENASPTSSFGIQTVSLDLSGYQMVLMLARISTQYDEIFSNITPVGRHGRISGAWGSSNETYHRDYEISTTGIYFYGAYDSGNYNTAYVVPTRIYGIKGVT